MLDAAIALLLCPERAVVSAWLTNCLRRNASVRAQSISSTKARATLAVAFCPQEQCGSCCRLGDKPEARWRCSAVARHVPRRAGRGRPWVSAVRRLLVEKIRASRGRALKGCRPSDQ
jgi:hypothetical protein